MKARIIRHDVSRVENGVRKGFGEIVEITKEELKTGGYAPLKINVKPKKKKKNVKSLPKEDVQPSGNAQGTIK